MADNEKVEEYITEIKLLDKNDNKKKFNLLFLFARMFICYMLLDVIILFTSLKI